jgi:hypothetical protein
MKYLFIFIFLLGCGIKPNASCDIDIKKETMKEITDNCIENPTLGIKKEF